MTRHTKVLLYTWLLSWVLCTPALGGALYAWGHLVVLPFRGPMLIGVPGPREELLFLVEAAGVSAAALTVAPVVYLSWRSVESHVPHDEDDA